MYLHDTLIISLLFFVIINYPITFYAKMDPETTSQTAIYDENTDRLKKIGKLVMIAIFIGTFIGNIVTIAIGVHLSKHCYHVAMVVMFLGSALGLIQQVPEYFRSFVDLESKTRRFVNYLFGFIIVLRISWLIAATVVISKARCDNITPAWICIFINWGIFGLILTIVTITVIVQICKKRSGS